MLAYAEGELGRAARSTLHEVDRIIAIGSDRMMAAVKAARHGVLAPYLKPGHVGVGSHQLADAVHDEGGLRAVPLQQHVDPETGKETFVFSCFNQDQQLDHVDFRHLNARLRANTVQEKLANLWLDRLLRHGA